MADPVAEDAGGQATVGVDVGHAVVYEDLCDVSPGWGEADQEPNRAGEGSAGLLTSLVSRSRCLGDVLNGGCLRPAVGQHRERRVNELPARLRLAPLDPGPVAAAAPHMAAAWQRRL